MKKLFLLVFLLVSFVICSCNMTKDDVETIIDGLDKAENGKVYEGTYDQFKNINIDASYLGYGYDLINDEYIKKDYINIGAPIIDLEKISKAKLKFIKENNAETIEIEGESMEEFSQNYSAALKINGKVGEVFSGGLSLDFKGNSNAETKTYSHFYKSILDVKTFNLYLTNSNEELKELLSEEFKYDLLNLNPEALFNKYGTHMLKEVSMGGRIEVTSQYTSTSVGASESVKKAVKSHMKYLKIASINTSLLIDAESTLHKENIDYYYNVKQIGGALTNINSVASLNEKYEQWLKSFDENVNYSALSGIVGENSLVALWDLLPNSENERRELLYNTFKQLSGDAFDKLCEDFKINTKRTLNVVTEGPGNVSEYVYQHEDGDNITLTATPNSDSRFIGWYNGDQLISNNLVYSFDIHVNTNLIAKFKKLNSDSCLLVVHISGKGEVIGNDEQIYQQGKLITLQAKALYNNTFEGWYLDNELVSTESFYIFNIEKDTTLVAKFTNNEIENLKLIVNVLGEGTGKVYYESEYYPQTIATVTAVPNEGSVFAGWYINNELVSINEEYSFIIEKNTNLVAKFDIYAVEEYTINLIILPDKCGNVKGIKNSYQKNELVTLIAEPVEGYKFIKWQVMNEDVIVNPYSFYIEENIVVVAFFEEVYEEPATVSYMLNNESFNISASISSNSQKIEYKQIPSLIIPTSRYLKFMGWYDDKEEQISDEEGNLLHNVKGYSDSYGRWIGTSCTLYAHWEINYDFIGNIYTYISDENEPNKLGNICYNFIDVITIDKTLVITSDVNQVILVGDKNNIVNYFSIELAERNTPFTLILESFNFTSQSNKNAITSKDKYNEFKIIVNGNSSIYASDGANGDNGQSYNINSDTKNPSNGTSGTNGGNGYSAISGYRLSLLIEANATFKLTAGKGGNGGNGGNGEGSDGKGKTQCGHGGHGGIGGMGGSAISSLSTLQLQVDGSLELVGGSGGNGGSGGHGGNAARKHVPDNAGNGGSGGAGGAGGICISLEQIKDLDIIVNGNLLLTPGNGGNGGNGSNGGDSWKNILDGDGKAGNGGHGGNGGDGANTCNLQITLLSKYLTHISVGGIGGQKGYKGGGSTRNTEATDGTNGKNGNSGSY